MDNKWNTLSVDVCVYVRVRACVSIYVYVYLIILDLCILYTSLGSKLFVFQKIKLFLYMIN